MRDCVNCWIQSVHGSCEEWAQVETPHPPPAPIS
jgi:hypothetical protein